MPSMPQDGGRVAMGQKIPANVQHSFDGDAETLHATFDRRAEIRKVLNSLQLDLQRITNQPVQIEAEIKINIQSKPASKQHTYHVSVTDSTFDAGQFSKGLSDSAKAQQTATPAASVGPNSSPSVSGHANGSRVGTGRENALEAIKQADVEMPPAKRTRVNDDDEVPETDDNKNTEALLKDALKLLRRGGQSGRIEDLFDFIRDWHKQWAQQGAWLFDTNTQNNKAQSDLQKTLERRLDGVQDILGQSINASNATTLAELANINKLIPWLEHCRKTSADKTQQREEKWRSSSATFHDTSRKDRESAEKRLEDKIEEQKRLLNKQQSILVKLAEANGIDPEEWKDSSREESLGAQLTAELNMEAARAGAPGAVKPTTENDNSEKHEPINVEDDET